MNNFEEELCLITDEDFIKLDKEFEKVNESCNTQVNLNTDKIQFNSAISTGLQNLTKKSEDETIVNTHYQKKFTDKHLDTTKRIISLEAYPELYGDKLPEDMEFIGFRIIPMNKLMTSINQTYGSQVARQTDNVKYNEVKNNIIDYGFKLRCNPIAVVLNADGTYTQANGRTRTKILNNNCHMENAIVSVYKVSSVKTFLTSSLTFNMTDTPFGAATQADVMGVASELITRGELKKDYNLIKEWVFTTCENGNNFTDNTKETMATSIFNNASTRPQIYSWKPDTIAEWMENHDFEKLRKAYPNISYGDMSTTKNNAYVSTKKGEEDFIYFVCAASYPTKNVYSVSHIANVRQFKNKIIRVIVHTSTLTGCTTANDLKEEYQNVLDKHNTGWEHVLRSISEAYYNGVRIKNCNIELWGALPAIREEHNMDKLVLF